MNSKEPNNRDAEIAAYMDGEMSPEATAAFETRMQNDPALFHAVEVWRAALDAARNWMGDEAPGVERAEQLAIPTLARNRARPSHLSAPSDRFHPSYLSRRPYRSYAWAALAAAAIFVAGFSIGQMTSAPFLPSATGPSTVAPVTVAPTAVNPPERQPGIQVVQPTPAPSTPKEPERRSAELAGVPVQRYTDESGRLVVETTLKSSGARALWVVDGSFQLASHNR